MNLKGALLGLVLSLSVIACVGRPQRAVVGIWMQEEGSKVMEFFPEGTILVSGGPMQLTGNYKFLDKERVRLEFGGLGALAGPTIVTVQVNGAKMVLTDEKGQAVHYRRTTKDEAMARRTQATMRDIRIACEAYAIDHTTFPAGNDLAAIARLVAPTYIRELPLSDAWGSQFEYSCDGKTYQIRSLGSDRSRDAVPHPGANQGYEADIVLRAGALEFEQWPASLGSY